MTAAAPLRYDYGLAQAYCAQRGLVWDAGAIGKADLEFHAAGMSQRQVDVVMMCHIDAVRRAFDPARYRPAKRALIALWFLAPWALRAAARVGRYVGRQVRRLRDLV